MNTLLEFHTRELRVISSLLAEADEVHACLSDDDGVEVDRLELAGRYEKLDDLRAGLNEAANAIIDHAQGADIAETEARYDRAAARCAPYLNLNAHEPDDDEDPNRVARFYLDRLAGDVVTGIEHLGDRISDSFRTMAVRAVVTTDARLTDPRPFADEEVDQLANVLEPIVEGLVAALEGDPQ